VWQWRVDKQEVAEVVCFVVYSWYVYCHHFGIMILIRKYVSNI